MAENVPTVKIKAQPGQCNFDLDVNKKHIIMLSSQLIYCMWTVGGAWANSDAGFEVRTSFVG